MQTGTVLGIGVGQRTTNTVQVTDHGNGAFTVEWNGAPVHSFTGIRAAVIEAQRAKNDRITFNLIGSGTGGAGVAVGSQISTDSIAASDEGHPERIRTARTSGFAVQSGSVLTVTVNRPYRKTVGISNFGGGAVRVEWNGGAVHSFTGVYTIVVDAHTRGDSLDESIDDDFGGGGY
jgi:hypothetical protein